MHTNTARINPLLPGPGSRARVPGLIPSPARPNPYSRRYTYADLQTWETAPGERWELMNGHAYLMAAPSPMHQDLLLNLAVQFSNRLKGKPCQPHIAPFAVRLFPDPEDQDTTYFEPDLIVVCDAGKIDRRGCNGPPDLVVEIISPSSRSIDMVAKLNAYREAGVREYWVVDPEARSLYVFSLKDGEYTTRTYDAATPTLEPGVLPGCYIDLAALFALMPPAPATATRLPPAAEPPDAIEPADATDPANTEPPAAEPAP